MRTIKHKCDRCFHYGNNVTLSKKEIDLKTVRTKINTEKISGYPATFVFMAFDYFECPICHWCKFVKKKGIPNAKVTGFDY